MTMGERLEHLKTMLTDKQLWSIKLVAESFVNGVVDYDEMMIMITEIREGRL